MSSSRGTSHQLIFIYTTASNGATKSLRFILPEDSQIAGDGNFHNLLLSVSDGEATIIIDGAAPMVRAEIILPSGDTNRSYQPSSKQPDMNVTKCVVSNVMCVRWRVHQLVFTNILNQPALTGPHCRTMRSFTVHHSFTQTQKMVAGGVGDCGTSERLPSGEKTDCAFAVGQRQVKKVDSAFFLFTDTQAWLSS